MVVWKVVDTAEASFEVDDYENYVHVLVVLCADREAQPVVNTGTIYQ